LKNGEITGYSLFTFENDRIMMIEYYAVEYFEDYNYILGTRFIKYDHNGRRTNTQNEKDEIISWREYGENNLLEKVHFRNGRSRAFVWEKKTTRYNQDMYVSY
jgi:hypothetical protein